MQIPPSVARAGDLVRVRCRRWRVLEVRPYDECQVVALAGLDDDNATVVRHVIAPFDSIEPVARSGRLRTVRPARWRRACRALIAAAAPPGALRAARDASVELLAYQLEPALAVVRGLGLRLLLADAVGLGKTIQAGLVLAELRRRGLADRVLILTPAGLRDQWAEELCSRFGVDTEIVDAAAVRRRVAMLAAGLNPWTTFPAAVASIDYAKRPDVLPAVACCRWDAVVVDEAHGATGPSDRHDAVSLLAARAACVLLLTATPHSGDSRAFVSLCDLGAHGDRLLVFRRTRADVHLAGRRRVHRLHVRPSPAESRMHALLDQFTRAVRAERGETDRDLWLALSVLHKRALSSPHSLEQSVVRRSGALTGSRSAGAAQLPLEFLDADGETDLADRAPEWLPSLALQDSTRELAMLNALASAAREATEGETKIALLRRLLARIREPAIIFTEYRDTLLHLRASLGVDVVALHGGLGREERRSAIDAFVRGRCPVLLATDAAGEGLNLHQGCRTVVNLELPWNPMRLEQRIGRVDRIGQHRPVHAFHLIAAGTGESRILDRLRARVARARVDFGSADPLDADEEPTARVVIGGSAPQQPEAPQQPGLAADANFQVVDLGRDAARECSRLAAARRVIACGDDDALGDLEARGTWLARARNRRTRNRLGGRLLLLTRVADEDASGRVIDAGLVGLVLTPATTLRAAPADTLDRVLRDLRPELDRRVAEAARSWREDLRRIHLACVETRRRRELGLATAASAPVPAEFQPGLFDRRAERERRARDTSVGEALEDARGRLAAVERSAMITEREPELLLVLVP
jgi:superfamily II DNA or RNA helicase